MIILHLAMRATHGLAVLAKRKRAARVENGVVAISTGHALRAARDRGKYVVGVHGADHKGTAEPGRPAGEAARHLLLATLQTFHADGVEE